MNDTTSTEHHADCEPLLELATPNVYRRNLFRVLGVPVGASPRDVQRQQQRRKMQERLGLASAGDSRGILPLDPPPTDEEVRAALERLNRPIDRLLDEIFWFWPTNGDPAADEALQALERGEVQRAADVWRQQTRGGGNGHIAAHNVAVLGHLVALDQEARLASTGSGTKHHEKLAELWRRALGYWKTVIEDEEFWSVVRDRVRDLNDVQLTTGFVRRVRGTLPTAILLISAKIAYGAAERSDAAIVQRHVRLIREAAFGDALADQAIQEAVKPLRNRIKAATDNARNRWTRKPYHGHRYVRELHEQAVGLLAVLDAILPPDDLTRGGLHDAVAEAMLLGQIAFGQKTNDWRESIALLQLARQLAAGEAMRSRLDENINVLQENAKQANDWCSPGYWDLSEEIVESLEAARAQSQAGNHEAAIRALVALDPRIGRPLRRCVAFALSLRGIQLANQAAEAFTRPTSKLQRFLDVIQRNGTVRVPNPYMESWMLPPCPCCGGSSYTQWANGEYRGQPFWMCSSCSWADDQERERRKHTLKGEITTALEYVILADEIDPGDPGVLEQLEAIKKIAREFGASIPNTKSLRKNLGGGKAVRGTRHTFEPTAEDGLCCFCGQNAGDDSCRITVPMCGGAESVDLLFGKGVEYRYGDVAVPRCRRCRDEHRELPGRVAKWQEARRAAADDKHFPELAAEVRSAERVAREAAARVTAARNKVAAAQSALQEAQAIGTKCDRCKSGALWDDGLCRRCDKEVYQFSTLGRVGVTAAAVAMIAAWGILAAAAGGESIPGFIAVVGGALPLGGLVALVVGLKREQWQRRSGLRQDRLAAQAKRRASAVDQAQKQLNQATAACQTVEQAARKPIADYKAAMNRLQAAKDEATAEFERIHPEPALARGIKPESDYLQFRRIRALRADGWGFGHQAREDGRPAAAEPVGVTGLVACQSPAAAVSAEVVASAAGGGALESRSIDVGTGLGAAVGSGAQGGASSVRDRIREMARQANADDTIACPICGTTVKAKNLVQHYDRNHNGEATPRSASGTAQRRAGDSSPAASSSRLADRIVEILRAQGSLSGLYVSPDIPERKAKNAATSCRVPDDDAILGLIDCTVFGSASDALVFGRRGFYYHNPAGNVPDPGFVAYSEFPEISFGTSWLNCITLGGDRYCNKVGSNIGRDKIIEMLEAIRNAVIESSRGEGADGGNAATQAAGSARSAGGKPSGSSTTATATRATPPQQATWKTKPQNPANRREWGNTTIVDGNCPHCGARTTFSRPNSTFWSECPACKGRVWLE